MRIGVIRGDLPGPLSITDLESVSQYNPPTEPRGQERRLGRPSLASVTAALAKIGSSTTGSVTVTTGATITGSNNRLRVRTASTAGFGVAIVVQAVYANGGALVTALNSAIAAAGIAATASLSSAGKIVLQSSLGGPTSYLEIDTTAHGSTFNAVAGFTEGPVTFTLPTPAAVILATIPVGGPLNVSDAALIGLVGAGVSSDQLVGLADALAPRIVETDVAIKSFQVGQLGRARDSHFNPDSRRLPAFTLGPAIAVVQDDGVTAYTAPLTVITGAVHDSPHTGDITVTGTNLGHPERMETHLRVISADGTKAVRLTQVEITRTFTAGTLGAVTATSIVLPASLLKSLGVVGSKVVVQYTSLVSNTFAVT